VKVRIWVILGITLVIVIVVLLTRGLSDAASIFGLLGLPAVVVDLASKLPTWFSPSGPQADNQVPTTTRKTGPAGRGARGWEKPQPTWTPAHPSATSSFYYPGIRPPAMQDSGTSFTGAAAKRRRAVRTVMSAFVTVFSGFAAICLFATAAVTAGKMPNTGDMPWLSWDRVTFFQVDSDRVAFLSIKWLSLIVVWIALVTLVGFFDMIKDMMPGTSGDILDDRKSLAIIVGGGVIGGIVGAIIGLSFKMAITGVPLYSAIFVIILVIVGAYLLGYFAVARVRARYGVR
jgi:hypothetical protein